MSYVANQPLPQPMSQSTGHYGQPFDPVRKIADLEGSIDFLSGHIKQLQSQMQTCLSNDKQANEQIAKLELGQKRLIIPGFWRIICLS